MDASGIQKLFVLCVLGPCSASVAIAASDIPDCCKDQLDGIKVPARSVDDDGGPSSVLVVASFMLLRAAVALRSVRDGSPDCMWTGVAFACLTRFVAGGALAPETHQSQEFADVLAIAGSGSLKAHGDIFFCAAMRPAGVAEESQQLGWSKLSFRGILDPMSDYGEKEAWSKTDVSEMRRVGCMSQHLFEGKQPDQFPLPIQLAGSPCCCDMRLNFWVETLRITLQISNASDPGGPDAAFKRDPMLLPLSQTSEDWGTVQCKGNYRQALLDFQQQWSGCLAGHAALRYICARQHMAEGDWQTSLLLLADLNWVLGFAYDFQWSCLGEMTPWPFTLQSLRNYIGWASQHAQQQLLQRPQQQQPQAASIASPVESPIPTESQTASPGHTPILATVWAPGLSTNLFELPLEWRRCLQTRGSLRACWGPSSEFLTSSCLFCCHPQHGPQGYPDCFDSTFTFTACCDGTPSTAVAVLAPDPSNAYVPFDLEAECSRENPVPVATTAAGQAEQEEARRTLAELSADLQAARRLSAEADAATGTASRASRMGRQRRLAARRLRRRRSAQRRLAAWLRGARKAQLRSRTELFPELDLWVASKACVNRGRWFLLDGEEKAEAAGEKGFETAGRPPAVARDLGAKGEVDGVEFGFSHAGFCSKDGGVASFTGEDVSDTLKHRHAIVPRRRWEESGGQDGNGSAFGIEHYPLDVLWSELMPYDRPPANSTVEWRSGGAVLVKEPLWSLGHGVQEMLWLWNVFRPDLPPLSKLTGPLQVVFMRWAAYEFSSMGLGGEAARKEKDPGALLSGLFSISARNSKPSLNGVMRLLYEAVAAAAARGGTDLGRGRVLDRRGAVYPAPRTPEASAADMAAAAALHASKAAEAAARSAQAAEAAAGSAKSQAAGSSQKVVEAAATAATYARVAAEVAASTAKAVWATTTDEAVIAGDPTGTLCFDHVLQSFRSWPGGASTFNSLREDVLHGCGFLPMHEFLPRRLVVVERGPSVLGGGRRDRMWADGALELRRQLAAWGKCRGFGVRFVNIGALRPCEMVEEVASAGILLGVHGADMTMGALQPAGAVMIEVDAKSCAARDGIEWQEKLRYEEAGILLGEGQNLLNVTWSTRAGAKIKALREAFERDAGHGSCPHLTHTDLSGKSRRRRYMSEGRATGTGFLGQAGGGIFSELARQRNLLYLNLQRCECAGVPEGITTCMFGQQSPLGLQLNDSHSPAIRLDVGLHVIPLLDVILKEYFDHYDG
ncbi:unnamed protein product [Polarella glacialis]|uniref:Uncharacterized protein n=1 Tax=Polarella glacialis TaxID=89957 RepID=A0A813I1V6_POLGL|nr:unnamed protein product [Polarella glacialis]